MDAPRPHAAPQVIIAGYGVPGHAAAELLAARGVPFVIIDANADNGRCAWPRVIVGDVRDPAVLCQAGIQQAQWLILAVPSDAVCLTAIDAARKLNPHIRIIARCVYTSGGLQALTRGASQVIVAEQVVAQEMSRLMEEHFPESEPN